MRVDVQTHVLPLPYLEALERRRAFPSAFREEGEWRVRAGPHMTLPVSEGLLDPEEKLRAMDAAGVDVSLLSLNIPGPEGVEGEEGERLARLANDALAEVCSRHPDRFWGLASLACQQPDRSLRELDRCVRNLDFRGLQLFSNIAGHPLDHPSFERFYKRLCELDIPLVLHPAYPVMADAMADHQLIPTVGFMFDTTLAALRLIQSGVLERYPSLRVVLPHGGSTLPYLLGRIDYLSERHPGARAHIGEAPSAYFARFYVDSVTSSRAALEYCLQQVGPGRLLFASDHPWVPLSRAVELVEGLPLGEGERRAVFGETAAKLFRGMR